MCALGFRNISLFGLIYTGFVRMISGSQMSIFFLEGPLYFTYAIEIGAHAAPLMCIQYYNNTFMEKFDIPLDFLNALFTGLHVGLILFEVCIA